MSSSLNSNDASTLEPSASGADTVTPPRRSTLVRVAFAYLLITLVFTWPLVLHLPTQTPFLGLNYALLANAELIGEQLSRFESPFVVSRIFHPVGYTIHEGFWPSFLAWLLGFGVHPLLGLNLSVLLSFVLAGLGTFLLVSEFVKSRWAAFLAGMYFSFSAVHAANLAIYPARHLECLPWFLYALFLHRRTRSHGSLILLAASFLVACLSSWYFAVFCGLIYALFVLTWLLEERSIQVLTRPSLVLATCCLLLLPISPPALLGGFGTMSGDINLTIDASADLLSYLLPSPRHGLFGPTVDEWQRGWAGNRPLRANYLGTLSLLVALYGILFMAGKRRWRGFLGALGVLALVLSLGPVLTIGGHDGWTLASPDLPSGPRLPYLGLVEIFPFSVTRATARYGFLTLLVCAVGFGLGCQRLEGFSRERLRARAPVAILFVVLAIEFLPRWPMPLRTPIPVPEFHQRLNAEAGIFSVLELPFEIRSYRTLYKAQAHPHQVLGGSIDKPFQRFAREMRRYPFLAMLLRASERGLLEPYLGEDIFGRASSRYAVAALDYLGVRYASVDRWAGNRLSFAEIYDADPRSEILADALEPHFLPHSEEKLVRTFARELGDSWLFPRLGQAWGSLADHGTHRSRVILDAEGTVEVLSNEAQLVDLNLELAPFGGERDLVVTLNGESVLRERIPAQPDPSSFHAIEVKALQVHAGENLLTLSTPQPTMIVKTPDGEQEVSFRVRSFSILPASDLGP